MHVRVRACTPARTHARTHAEIRCIVDHLERNRHTVIVATIMTIFTIRTCCHTHTRLQDDDFPHAPLNSQTISGMVSRRFRTVLRGTVHKSRHFHWLLPRSAESTAKINDVIYALSYCLNLSATAPGGTNRTNASIMIAWHVYWCWRQQTRRRSNNEDTVSSLPAALRVARTLVFVLGSLCSRQL